MNDNLNVIVNNEYDYSNIVPEIDNIVALVKQCSLYYAQLLKLEEEDAKKNERLKVDYQSFQYAKSYSSGFKVSFQKNDSYNSNDFENYESFKSAVDSGFVRDAGKLTIHLDLSYRSGSGSDLTENSNEFTISFEPYNIKFTRKSNKANQNMDQIEYAINELLKRFKVQNTIFCSK